MLAEQLTHWKNLRHDLERARMLIELIRKREKLKREHLKMVQSIKELQMKPLNTLIRRMIERLRRKDPADIFAEPVSVDEVSYCSEEEKKEFFLADHCCSLSAQLNLKPQCSIIKDLRSC